MELYYELGKKNITYFHIDITKKMESIFGTGVFKAVYIMSPSDHCAYEPNSIIDEFFNQVKHTWETQGVIYHGWFGITAWLCNGKKLELNTGSQFFKANEVG